MAYSDFRIADVRQRLGMTVTEGGDLFADIPEVELPPSLATVLARYLPLALNLNTEKARSELLIAPLLVELKLLYPDRLSVFSGIASPLMRRWGWADGATSSCLAARSSWP